MFYLIFILLSLCLFIIISMLGHEYGHALAARLIGWKTHGMTIRWYGAGYKVEINDDKPEDIWKVAAGGLIISLFLFIFGLIFSLLWPGFLMLAYINFFILIFNIIPYKGLDGYYLWQRLTARFRHPSDLHSETQKDHHSPEHASLQSWAEFQANLVQPQRTNLYALVLSWALQR